MKITPVNPDSLHKNPAFSQGVLVEGGKTLYIGGQNGILPDGSLAGKDLASQTEQAYKNMIEILKSVGASQKNVVKQNIYIAKGQSIQEGFVAAQKVWGKNPTAISVLIVEGLGTPGAGVLVEVDAIAVIEA
ncbi:MAG TPA: RidA family protein [Fibrobacteria bacterium]|nr:RidA family protein [Fibrobacteria bacterium]